MKNIKKVFASLIAAALLFGFTACNKQSQPTLDPVAAATSVDLSGVSYDTVYGSQLNGYLDRQYIFEGREIPKAQANFYFINAFSELSRYASYGYYPMTAEGYIDLSAAVVAEDTEYSTYGDFFLAYAERMLESTLVMNELAAQEGLTLSAETEQEIEATIASVEASSAAPAGLTMDQYLQLYFGPSANVDAFRQIIHDDKMVDIYSQHFIDTYEFSADELNVPNIRYVLISAPEGSDEETMTAAEEKANQIFENSTDLEQLELQGALAYTNGDALESSVIAVERGKCVPDFEDWAYEDHEEGDIDIIYAPQYGYFVVGYVGETEIPEASKEEICVVALGDMVNEKIEAGEYSLYSNDPITPAQPVVVETDPVTGMIITSTPAPAGLSGISTPARVGIIVAVIALVGGIAFFIYNRVSGTPAVKEEAPVKKASEDSKEDEE